MYLSCIYFLVLLHIFSIDAGNIVCRTTEKCDCINITSSGRFEYQCPPNAKGSKTIIHVYPAAKKLTIDCNKTDVLDNTVLPKANFEVITKLYIQECPLPRNGFREVVDNFNIRNLEYLSFKELILNDTLNYINLEGLDKLKVLEIKKKNISVLDGTIFKNTPNLSELMLDENRVELTESIFRDVPNLRFLSIHSNNISYIPTNTFRYLVKLERLDLWKNNLEHLDVDVFVNLTNLRSLELSLNKFETLDGELFRSLTSLVSISLRRNKLRRISREVFGNCRNIELIRLDENFNLTLVDDVFSNFTNLKTVNLAYDGLRQLSENLFSGSVNLKTILLNHNRLKFLPRNIFKDLRNLEKLKLNDNKIEIIHPDTFSSLESVEYLYLQYNNLDSIDEHVLQGLKNLKEINLSYNKIKTMHPQSLSRNAKLVRFFMSNNQFDFERALLFGSNIPFSSYSCTNLKLVDLSYNKVTRYPYEINGITTLEEMRLGHNDITELRLDGLQSYNPDGMKMNLDFNKISKIIFDNMMDNDVHFNPLSVKISHNPILCDCHALNLAQYVQNKDHPLKGQLSLKFSRLDCAAPPKMRDSSLEEVRFEDLVCTLDRNCTRNGECDCMYRSVDSMLIVNCSERGLSTIPELTVADIPARYDFVNLNQTEIRLEGNELERCPGEYEGYGDATRLYLQNNRIRNVTWLPDSLKVLDLSRNALQSMDAFAVELLNKSSIEELHLAKNPWKCDCDIKNFSVYLREHMKQVDMLDIRCNITGKRLVDLNENDLCPTKLRLILILAFGLLFCLLIIATTFSFYYTHQKEILVWLYGRGFCLWLVKEEELDKDKIYDGFLSYSSKDEEFVIDNLVSVLEGGENPYKLCIHVRDWIPGELIHTQISNSVRDSKRTIVVLSSNFLESVWGKVEFKLAHTEAMREGRARVIIIIYGDIDMDALDDELKAYMRTNTYIKWGDPYFWDKLKYALPRIPRRRREMSRKHANMMQFIDDKFQLVTQKPSSKPLIVLDPGNLEERSLTCVA